MIFIWHNSLRGQSGPILVTTLWMYTSINPLSQGIWHQSQLTLGERRGSFWAGGQSMAETDNHSHSHLWAI